MSIEQLPRTGPTDGDLVRKVLRGERPPYEELIRRHQDRLYRHAWAMTEDSDVAADLVQDSLIKGFVSLEQCRDPDSFGSWIFRILRNQTLDYLKNRRRSELPLDAVRLRARSPDDPHASAESADIGSAIREALGTLPTDQREAFVLKHMEDCSYDEMADMVGASTSALKMRVKRAREALQVVLDGYQTAGL